MAALPLPAFTADPGLAAAAVLAAKATVLLCAAAGGALLLRRRSAAARHLLWTVALAMLLVLPAFTLALPRWELPFVALPAAPASAGNAAPGVAGDGLAAMLLAVWAAGALVVLGRYAAALVGVRVITRRATVVRDGEWTDLVARLSRELGGVRPVRLLRAPGAAMPMTWGAFRATVLLPADAELWSGERRRVVLLHELAHVARRDCLSQLVATLACAAYWFHPLAWWAAWRMREEREQACDDRVLAAGTRASDYATHLLDVARTSRAPVLAAAAAVGMARRSQLEGRVVAVLDVARSRARVPWRAGAYCAAAGAAVLVPLAAAAPGRGEEPTPELASARVSVTPRAPAPAAAQPVAGGEELPERAVQVALASSGAPEFTVLQASVYRAAAAAPQPAAAVPAQEPTGTLAALIRAASDYDPVV
ncbi:MAG TPA: M56 family metallopeptidase, partial [Longimicrobium sp.]|nr:M56 family metallopeptidase [Longimicrobium sp.]